MSTIKVTRAAAVKISLDGLVSGAGDLLRRSQDGYGPFYAYALDALRDQVHAVVDGQITVEELAESFAIRRPPAPTDGD